MKTKLLALLLVLCTLFLCNCSASPEYEKVELTKKNYDEYLSINIYISDFSLLEGSGTGTSSKRAIATVNITTSPKGDYRFEDVSITYLHDNSNTPWNSSVKESYTKATANLDYLGYSHTSYAKIRTVSVTQNVSYNYNYFLPQKNSITVSAPVSIDELIQSISGYVLVPVE